MALKLVGASGGAVQLPPVLGTTTTISFDSPLAPSAFAAITRT
jgi:hypothetical protein